MLWLRKNCRAQSIAEYAAYVTLISVVMLGLTVYMRRGIQGAIKVAADEVGKQEDMIGDAEEDKKEDSTSTTVSQSENTYSASTNKLEQKRDTYSSSTSSGLNTSVSLEENEE